MMECLESGQGKDRLSHRRMSITAACRRIGRTVKDALFPGVCFACGRLYPIAPDRPGANGYASDGEWHFERLLTGHLCAVCRSQYTAIEAPMCSQCGLPFESPHGRDHLCNDCLSRPPAYAEARGAGIYKGSLRHTIHQLKYTGREKLARPLGRLLWETLCRYWAPDQFDRVVPVPLHAVRLRKRGFNQAHALLGEWPRLAMRDGLKLPEGWIAPHLLVRSRPTDPQTGLKRDRRLKNLHGAFRPGCKPDLQNRTILLVDDVMTTGTTADICARTLLNAGAANVKVLTLARALH
jgi:ComF family protein